MNGTSRSNQTMYDPYAQGANDPWAAAPENTMPRSSMQNAAGMQGSAQGGSTGAQSNAGMQQGSTALGGAGMQAQGSTDASRFQHGLSEQVIGNPISVEEAYLGSMQAMLAREIGAYIGAVFIIGTGQMLRSEGRLTEVGNNYIVIYQQDRGRYVVGDLNSLRFVEFFEGNSIRGNEFQGVGGIMNAL